MADLITIATIAISLYGDGQNGIAVDIPFSTVAKTNIEPSALDNVHTISALLSNDV
jgi:hypothetical protein